MRFRARLQHLVTFLRRQAWVGLLVFVTVFLSGALAFARAGGGQHYSPPSAPSYSGGGYHGSNGYSGSGGGGDVAYLLFWIIRLTFEIPYVMVPLWLVVAFLIYRGSQQRASVAMPREVVRMEERRVRPASNVNAAIAELKGADPAFDLDAFFERVRKTFLDVQEAWFLRNLDTVRLNMSDGLYRRFTTLLALMKLENQRNGLADAKVMGATLLEVTRTNAYDCLTVRIDASLRDVDVPASYTDDQARKAANKAAPDEFSEMWTFVRRRGVKTQPGFDTSQGKCPNCGAPFTGGAANKCEYCNSIINSGNFDWVLAEITQPSEYLPHDRAAPGLDNLRARDPDAAAELLQDRGLLLFWKWLEAWAFGETARLMKIATPAAVTGIGSDIDAMKQKGGSLVVRNPAVGGTRIAAVETDADGFDRVHVEIRWSAIMGSNRASGAAQPYRSIVTMIRKSDATTDKGVGLSNERCGNCSAPLTDSDSTKCDYCGHDLAGASKEWQLDAFVPYEQWDRPTIASRHSTAAFATGSERLRLMSVMVAIVKADGVIEPSELRLLRDCAVRWNIQWPKVQEMLDAAVDESFGNLSPKSPPEARAFLEQIIGAAKVDGRIDRRERTLIYRAAEKLGLEKSVVDEMLG